MDEYISREAVIRYLKGFSEKELNSSSFGMITSSVLNKAERAISEMPAADVQPVNDWISVKDKLPDDHEGVLVWFEYFRYGDYNDYNRSFQRYAIGNYVDKTWYINGETAWLQQLQVIAWQKLPEPPKE